MGVFISTRGNATVSDILDRFPCRFGFVEDLSLSLWFSFLFFSKKAEGCKGFIEIDVLEFINIAADLVISLNWPEVDCIFLFFFFYSEFFEGQKFY